MLTVLGRMSRWDLVLAIGVAIICVLAAAALRLLIDFWFGFGHAEDAPFFPAVLLATLFGGLVAGIIALVLSVIFVWWTLPPTPFVFEFGSIGELINLAIYTGALALIVWGSEHYRQLKEAAEALANRLKESDQTLRLSLEQGRMGMWEWNTQTNEILWSPGLEAIHGLTPGTFGGSFADYSNSIHPEDRDHVARTIAQTIKFAREHHLEYRIILPDGTVRWVEERGSVPRYESGRPAAWMIGVCADITDRKQAEDKLKMVAQELEHRGRNVLARVKAMVRMTTADTVSDFVQILSSRIDAFARLNSLLRADKYQSTDLERVIAEEITSLCKSERRTSIRGPKLALSATGVESLGMVIHEMTTNAVKYGALSRPDAHLAVEWDLRSDRRLAIEWIESGVPLDCPKPRRKGFGTRLVQAVVQQQLQGEVHFDWHTDGLHCRLDLPTRGILADADMLAVEQRTASPVR
jgi:PAS domain S-box-containing protein